MIVQVFVIVSIVAALVLLLLVFAATTPQEDSIEAAKAKVALHEAQRRLEVSQIRNGIRADTLRLRRELDRDLRKAQDRGGNRDHR
jgi:hypothetical protein